MKNIELLAPAGDINKLKTAIMYGADAVYFSGSSFGLRTASKNFSREELEEAVNYCHERSVKAIITVNIIAHQDDIVKVIPYLKFLRDIGVDGIIVSDMGIFSLARENVPDLPVHISTQASITNSASINFMEKNGAERMVLAREVSIDEIRDIRKNISQDMELEYFVHGAMCISYSGRCLLSNYMAKRDANQGDCAQACRWNYALMEEKRPGEYYPIEEDSRGTYIFNSKDLCLLKELPLLIDAGVNSLKIEGRVKTQYYLATVIRSYRLALDAIKENRFTDDLADYLIKEIKKASYRSFTTGFFYGRPDGEGQNYGSSSYIRNYDFIGEVKSYDEDKGLMEVEQRNHFKVGDQIEIFGPGEEYLDYKVERIFDDDMREVDSARHPQMRVFLPITSRVKEGYMLRRKCQDSQDFS